MICDTGGNTLMPAGFTLCEVALLACLSAFSLKQLGKLGLRWRPWTSPLPISSHYTLPADPYLNLTNAALSD